MTALSDDELKDLAHSAYEEAMSFGLSVDTFLRYFKGIRNRALLAAQPAQERQTYKPGNGGDCAICRQPEGDHYRHGNDCPDMRGVGQAE